MIEQLESEKKMIVFAHHLKMLDVIEEATRKKVCIAKLLMEKNYVDAVLMLY